MSIRRNIAFGWLLALLVIALFTRLGFWQLGRMHQKQAMLDAVHAVLHDRRPQPLAVAADPQRGTAYAWSAGAGRFAALPAILLDNQGRGDRAGVRAYRVFQPVSGMPLLVELGWLPLPGDRRLPEVPLPATTHVAGLLLPPPSAGIVDVPAVAQPDGTLLAIALDLPMLRHALRLPALAPRVLKLDPAQRLAPGPAYARDLDILPNTLPPERHLGYAVQWFGLALAVLATALVLTFRKPARTQGARTPRTHA
ncbi:SURF1 family protein [Luteimonas sp. 50]|uniref:SURF1-like protein n=1 Tax=Cognatiluteimonas sedimenti TaxID=2927791 RepID=A0ABT0A695_9GAMM|nr:SURF1 family protein [Lysobacter sedimenti]MCJ0826502.1 SURF1 family protein [Lysobacter sedimenti]